MNQPQSKLYSLPVTKFLACLALTAVLFAGVSGPVRAGTLGDAVDRPDLTWTTGGEAPWFFQTATTHDGLDAAQAGIMPLANGTSWLETTVTGRVSVAFWWKLSSDPGWYTFTLYTNGAWADYLYNPGEADWQPAAVSFAGGTNLIRWRYNSPPSNPTNWQGNSAWVDQVLVTNIAGLAPVFLAQPAPTLAAPEYAYSSTNLPALAIGDLPMTYQWQRNGTNLTEGWPFYRVNSLSLNFYPRTAAESGGAFRLVASNSWGMATSEVCAVTIVPASPFIPPYAPQDVELALGESYSLSVPMYGSPPFHYQWFTNGTAVPWATNYYYPLWPATLADAGAYRVVVTNLYGTATSRVAQVSVSTAPPVITSGPNPEVVEAAPGEYVWFGSEVVGPQNLHYSWRRVGDAGLFGTYSSFAFESADPTNSGLYRLIVTNLNGAVTSRVSVLAVAPVTALALALDSPGLTITNHHAWWPRWAPDVTGTNAHDGLCAARSPAIGDYDSYTFGTTVTGPTNLSFWWRISAGAQAFLDLSVNGTIHTSLSGETPWQQQTLSLPAGEHALAWTFRKQNAGQVGQDAAWVDELVMGSSPPSTGEITNFITGGNAPWFAQSTNTHDGLEAWQSGLLAENEQSWLETTVTGPGTFTFWWMVESEECCDPLTFAVDGMTLTNIAGMVGWRQESLALPFGSHTLRWTYSKDGGVEEPRDAGWVDEVRFVPDSNEVVITNFLTGGDADWYLQATNVHTPPEAWQSGAVTYYSSTWLQTTVEGPGTVSFWWSVDADECCDSLEFWLDSDTGTNLLGTVGWHKVSWPVEAGLHTLDWIFSRGGGSLTGAGWLDDVTFTPGGGGSTPVPPVIVTNPLSQVVAEFASASFSVVATGTPPLFYQWYYYDSPIQNATNDTYFIMFAERAYQGPYHVVVSNHAGVATSDVADLQILMRPIIGSINPWSQSVVVGSNAQFYASVSATYPVAFQWYHDGVKVPGATNINLVLTNVAVSDAGAYRLAATNAYGGALSSSAQLSVLTRPIILSWPSPITRNLGQSASFSVTATGAPPLFYQWRKAGVDITGASGTSYSIPSVTTNDAATYSVVITNSYGSTNASALLTVVVPPYLVQGPSNQTVLAGSSIYLSAIAGGTPTLNYRWRRFGTNVPGATANSLRLAPATTNHAGPYDVVVSSTYGAVTSAPALVVVNPVPSGYSPTAQDTNFATSLGADDWVGASAALPDGRWIIGGAFKTVHGLPRRAIARLNADGTVDPTFTSPLPPISSFVEDLAVQPDGRIVIGGLFYTTNGCTNLARLNPDGSLDTSFVAQVGSTSGNMNGVTSLALASGGRVLVGGRFTSINGVHRSLLGMVSTNGSLDTSFVPPEIYDITVSPAVRSVVVQPDGKVIYGTAEEVVGAPYVHRSVYRLLANGQPDATFVSPDIVPVGGLLYGGNSTYAMALQPNGKLVCALESRVVRLLTNGSLDTNFAVCQLNFRFDGGQGHSLVVVGGNGSQDGRVLLGGHFTALNGTNYNSLALLDANGTVIPSYTPGTGGENELVNTLSMAANGRLLVGGLFNSLGGWPRLNLGFYGADGTFDPTAYAGKGALGNYYGVSAMAVMPDGRIVIGGDFTNVNGVAVSGVARLLPDASLDPTFNAGTGPDNRVVALALQADGKVIIGGMFSNVASHARMKLARLNLNGSVDTNFNPVLGDAFVEVDALAVQPGGRILVGGFFRSVNGTAITNLARLHPDGSLDTSFAIGTGPDNGVLALAVRSDGTVAAGGWFQNFNGQYAPGLALLDANGARLPMASYPPQQARKLASAPDGTIYVGTASGSAGSPTLWQINVDGTIAAFVNALGAWYSMDAIALGVQPDGRLLALGYTDKSLRRFNRDRVEDPLFPLVTINGAFSLACQPDGHILAGGNIMTLALAPGGPTVTRHGVVRFNGDALLLATPSLALRILAPVPVFTLAVQGAAGQAVTIEASGNLRTWLPVLTTNLPAGGSAAYADPATAAHSLRFYRAVSP